MPGLPQDVAIVAICVIAVDRALALAFRSWLAARIARASNSAARPRVKLAAAPFLPQLAAGRYRRIDITMGAFSAGGIEFSGLLASAQRIQAPPCRPDSRRAAGAALAAQVTATAIIAYSVIAARLPAGLRLQPDGANLRVSGTVMLVPVTGALRIRAEPRQIAVTPKVTGVPALVGFMIRLPGLPDGVELTGARVSPVGLEVTARGESVRLAPATRVPGGTANYG